MRVQYTIAFLGVSGVGKSTFLRELAADVAFQHLQASALIAKGREVAEGRRIETDSLRTADIDQNQQFLISGYWQSVDPSMALVVLDGHSLIDTPEGLVPVASAVFRTLNVSQIIYLADSPSEIERRRQADRTRNRPVRTVDDLRRYQDAALLRALEISLDLGVALTVVTPALRKYSLQLFIQLSSRNTFKP